MAERNMASNAYPLSAQALCRRTWAARHHSPALILFVSEALFMRIAEIEWPVFWQALRQQSEPTARAVWLARWVFADEAVKLSLRPSRGKKFDWAGVLTHPAAVTVSDKIARLLVEILVSARGESWKISRLRYPLRS
jgi:hypothetical protein